MSTSERGSGLLPDPLLQRLVLPTLNEWKDESVNLAASHRWLGVLTSAAGYQAMRSGLHAPTSDSQAFLARAIEIDPADQIALARLIEYKIGVLDFHAHHLPERYLGDPDADLRVAQELEQLSGAIQKDSERDRLLPEVRACRQLILDWIEAQAVREDFRAWCRKRGRDYNWAITRIYVRKPEPTA